MCLRTKLPNKKVIVLLIRMFFLFCVFALSSCSLFLFNPVKIISYSPNASTVSNISTINQISVEFSSSMKTSLTESSFSLNDGEKKLYGIFSWTNNNKTLIFHLKSTLKEYTSYTIEVSTNAEDTLGNSLEKKFTHVFSSSDDKTQITITAVSPSHNSTISNQYEPIIISFSEAMNKNSFYEAFSISPSINGITSFDNSSTARFTPTSAYSFTEQYSIQVSTQLTDLNGNPLPDNHYSHFSIQHNSTPLQLTKIENYLTSTERAGTETLVVSPINNTAPIKEEWETNWGMVFTFNKKVNIDSFKSNITFSPSASYTLKDPFTNNQQVITITFNSKLRYNTRYTLHINKNLKDEFTIALNQPIQYLFLTNGKASLPPYVSKISFLTSKHLDNTPATSDIVQLFNNTTALTNIHPTINLTTSFATEQKSFFDIEFGLAENATLNIVNILNNISISSSSSVADISIMGGAIITPSTTNTDFTGTPPTITGPAPLNGIPATGINIARIYVKVRNRADSGLITININSSLEDSLENKIDDAWSLILQK